MASRTLYDQPATSLHWDSELVHVKPCITVQFSPAVSTLHQKARDATREKAVETALHMLDSVLARAALNTEDIILSIPPFSRSALVLSIISSPSFLSSLRSRLPSLDIAGREYSMDVVCQSVQIVVELDAAAALYSRLEHSLKAYTARILQRLATVCDEDTTGELTFMRLAHVWGHYRLAIAELQEVWVFFDRWYVSRTRAVRSIEGLAVAIMKTELLQHQWFLPRAQAGFLAFLRRDFKHEGAARQELLLFTNMCTSIEIYFLRVEQEILTLVSQFLKEEADRMWHSGVSAEVFFQQVHAYLQEGRQRVYACLNENTLPKLEDVMQTSLLNDHGLEILTRDFAQLIEQKKYDCVRRAWLFLASGPYVRFGKQCGTLFRQYVLGEGAAIMRRLSTRSSLHGEGVFSVVGAIMALICSSESAIQNCFAEELTFFTVQLNDALAEVLHMHQMEFAQHLAACVDWLMRGSKEGVFVSTSDFGGWGSFLLTDVTAAGSGSVNNNTTRLSVELPLAQPSASSLLSPAVTTNTTTTTATAPAVFTFSLETVLKYILRIYTLFPSKESFESFYWRDLARRLLHFHHIPNIEAEESFIQGLKKTCGVETSKFEGMVNDIRLSHELSERYQTWVAGKCEDTSVLRVDEAEENAAGGVIAKNESHYQQKCCGEEGGTKKRRREKKREIVSEEQENVINKEEKGESARVGDTVISAITALSGSGSSRGNNNNSSNERTEIQLSILTTVFWPKQMALTFLLPAPLHALAECIQEFYCNCFTGRLLVWQHQLSSAVVNCVFGAVRRQLTGTLLQVAMLLTMQEMIDTTSTATTSSFGGVVTVGALCERLGVDVLLPQVAISLLGMCHPKFRLLLREPAASGNLRFEGALCETVGSSGDGCINTIYTDNTHNDNDNNNDNNNINKGNSNSGVSDRRDGSPVGFCAKPMITAFDRVCFNPHFSLALNCTRMPLYNTKLRGDWVAVDAGGGVENTQTEADMKEQSHVVEAAIVRLMKEKRRMGHEELIAAVPALVNFPLTGSTIKHVIERLINRGFLERNAQAVYTYMS